MSISPLFLIDDDVTAPAPKIHSRNTAAEGLGAGDIETVRRVHLKYQGSDTALVVPAAIGVVSIGLSLRALRGRLAAR